MPTKASTANIIAFTTTLLENVLPLKTKLKRWSKSWSYKGMSRGEDENNTDGARNAVWEEKVLSEGIRVLEIEEKARQIGTDQEIGAPHTVKILAKRWWTLSQEDLVEAARLVWSERDTSGYQKCAHDQSKGTPQYAIYCLYWSWL